MKLKKIASLVLAVALTLGMSTAAFATEAETGTAVDTATTGTIKINAKQAGDTFDAYRIVDITYNTDNTLTYAFDSSVAAFFTSNGKNYTPESYCELTDSSDPALKALLGELAAWIKSHNVTTANHITAAEQTDGSISGSLGGLALGQYLVLGAGNAASGAYIYEIMTANLEPKVETVGGHQVYTLKTAEATNKSTTPTIAKTAQDDNDQEVSFYDKINYTITVTVPTYPASATNTAFSVYDNIASGVSIVPDTLQVVGYTNDTDTTGTVIAQNTNFTAGRYTFTYSQIKGYEKIVMTYTGKLLSTAAAYADLTNTATLTYSVDPYGSRTSDQTASAAVSTGSLAIVKVGEDNAVLADAEFDVYAKLNTDMAANLNDDTMAAVTDNALITTLKTAANAAEADTDRYYKVGHVTTDANGAASVSELEPGKYYLVETKAPSGYQIATNAIEVTAAENTVNTVENTKNGLLLPGTGGTGTQLFTVAGILILACAGAFLFFSRKRVFGK